jgi:hypothetical protein
MINPANLSGEAGRLRDPQFVDMRQKNQLEWFRRSVLLVLGNKDQEDTRHDPSAGPGHS